MNMHDMQMATGAGREGGQAEHRRGLEWEGKLGPAAPVPRESACACSLTQRHQREGAGGLQGTAWGRQVAPGVVCDTLDSVFIGVCAGCVSCILLNILFPCTTQIAAVLFCSEKSFNISESTVPPGLFSGVLVPHDTHIISVKQQSLRKELHPYSSSNSRSCSVSSGILSPPSRFMCRMLRDGQEEGETQSGLRAGSSSSQAEPKGLRETQGWGKDRSTAAGSCIHQP